MKKLTCMLLAALMLLTLAGCGPKKEPIRPEDFREYMEEQDFPVLDLTDQLDPKEYREACEAIDGDFGSVEFYEMKTEDGAAAAYNYLVDQLEKGYENVSTVNSQVTTTHQGTFKITGPEYYHQVVRVENTVLYATVYKENKDVTQNMIKELGY